MMLAFLINTSSIAFASEMSEDGSYWTPESSSPFPPCPSLPPGTYCIMYDTELETRLIFYLHGPLADQQHFRVRFTPQTSGELVREARIGWYSNETIDNTFEIHLVDANTGYTVVTGPIYEPANLNWEWKVYDVSGLAFYTSGDFYIELWGLGNTEMGLAADWETPIYGRSETNPGTGWVPITGTFKSDVRIRAVVEMPEAVGGFVVPSNKLDLLAPYIGLTSTIVVAMVATAIYIKRGKPRKAKQ